MIVALSIRQPWAWLIVNGYKDVENRDWFASYRGRLLIHAGQKFDAEGHRHVARTFPDVPMPKTEAEFQRGGIVGGVTMVGCVEASDSRWFTGRFGFMFEQPAPLPFRALRGQLGFFSVAGT